MSLVPKFKAFVPSDVAGRKDRVFVELSFVFQDPGPVTEPLQLTDPQYLQSASEASAATSLPRRASDAGVKRALAVVDCDANAAGRLSGCAVLREVPPDLGVGDQALSELSKRRLNLWQDARPVAGARLRIPFYIDSPAADADPAFTREAAFHVPGGWSGTAGPYYPDRAERMKIKGLATIECVLQPTGALNDCVAVSETPLRQDFMAAALVMAGKGAITARPAPAAGAHPGPQVVRLTVPFRP